MLRRHRVEARDGALIAHEDEDEEQVPGQREIHEGQRRRNDVRLLEAQDVGNDMEELLDELAISRASVTTSPR
jgi:hypothetical protein